jgi:hypothetical protein
MLAQRVGLIISKPEMHETKVNAVNGTITGELDSI